MACGLGMMGGGSLALPPVVTRRGSGHSNDSPFVPLSRRLVSRDPPISPKVPIFIPGLAARGGIRTVGPISPVTLTGRIARLLAAGTTLVDGDVKVGATFANCDSPNFFSSLPVRLVDALVEVSPLSCMDLAILAEWRRLRMLRQGLGEDRRVEPLV